MPVSSGGIKGVKSSRTSPWLACLMPSKLIEYPVLFSAIANREVNQGWRGVGHAGSGSGEVEQTLGRVWQLTRGTRCCSGSTLFCAGLAQRDVAEDANGRAAEYNGSIKYSALPLHAGCDPHAQRELHFTDVACAGNTRTANQFVYSQAE